MKKATQRMNMIQIKSKNKYTKTEDIYSEEGALEKKHVGSILSSQCISISHRLENKGSHTCTRLCVQRNQLQEYIRLFHNGLTKNILFIRFMMMAFAMSLHLVLSKV